MLAIVLAVEIFLCVVVKESIKTYGDYAVVQWAKQHGYSDKQIEDIRKLCLSVATSKPKN